MAGKIEGYQHLSGRELYELDCPDGPWTGRLDKKAWGKATNLMLYFTELATGNRYWLSVWHRNAYAPRQGGVDFKREAESGDVFELTTKKTKTGNPNLIAARKITDPPPQ